MRKYIRLFLIGKNMNIWTEKRTIVAVALSSLAFAQILDSTIVAIALTHIMGAMGANTDEVSWVLTSYIIAAAIFMPLAGMIAKKYGRKRVLLLSCAGFAVSSAICGLSTSLGELIVFRFIQGISGAFMPALSQGYIVDNFTEEERPTIMSMYGIAAVLGPVLGPILGGVITFHLDWPWIFFINVPVCAFAFVVISGLMVETEKISVYVDYISFIFLAVGVGLIELFLNAGNMYNWFGSRLVAMSFVFGILFTVFFFWRAAAGKSVVDFRVFKHRNFALSCFLTMCFTCFVYSIISFLPLMIENLYKYQVDTTGFVTSPRGIAAVICMLFVGKICKKIDAKYVLMFAIGVNIVACYLFTCFSPNQSMRYFFPPLILQGVVSTFFYIPIMLVAYYKFPKKYSDSAGGVFSFAKMFGASIGATVGATLLSRMGQVNWNDLSRNITPWANGFKRWMMNLPSVGDDYRIKFEVVADTLNKNATFLSYLDLFYLAMIGSIVLLLVPLLYKKCK
jgi:MFS transporter, DHA2 family, multidrug resistance protein